MSTLAELEARVAALENAGGVAVAGDSIVPTFQTIDAAGNVGAKFTGEIDAVGGVGIPASDALNPPNTRRIRWYRLADGSVLAADWAYDQPAGAISAVANRVIAANPAGVSPNGILQLLAYNAAGQMTGLVAEGLEAAAGPKRVSLFVGGAGSILWDSAGASDWQRDAQPTARLQRTTNQSIPNNAWTPITFDTVVRQLNGFAFDGALPTRLTVPKAGVYTLTANVRFDSPVGGAFRGVAIRRNGVASGIATILRPPPTAGNFPAIALPAEWRFAANDYAELYVYQDSGAALNVQALEEFSVVLAMTRLSA